MNWMEFWLWLLRSVAGRKSECQTDNANEQSKCLRAMGRWIAQGTSDKYVEDESQNIFGCWVKLCYFFVMQNESWLSQHRLVFWGKRHAKKFWLEDCGELKLFASFADVHRQSWLVRLVYKILVGVRRVSHFCFMFNPFMCAHCFSICYFVQRGHVCFPMVHVMSLLTKRTSVYPYAIVFVFSCAN